MSHASDPVGFDFAAIDTAHRYKLMSFTVVPRPIAWVSTVDAAGHRNLAPFSFFNVVATDPPLLALGITARPNGKDTIRHIRQSGEFVINLVPYALMDEMNISAIEFPPEIDEFDAAGLSSTSSTRVSPPRLSGSPVAYECKTFQLIELPSGQCIVIGQVVFAHIAANAVIDPDRCHVDTAALDLVGRMDNRYVRSGSVFDLPRLSLSDWQAGKRTP